MLRQVQVFPHPEQGHSHNPHQGTSKGNMKCGFCDSPSHKASECRKKKAYKICWASQNVRLKENKRTSQHISETGEELEKERNTNQKKPEQIGGFEDMQSIPESSPTGSEESNRNVHQS